MQLRKASIIAENKPTAGPVITAGICLTGLGQIMLYTFGMTAIIRNLALVEWIYTLTSSIVSTSTSLIRIANVHSTLLRTSIAYRLFFIPQFWG